MSREGISLARYWQLDRTAIGSRNCSPEDAARELRRLVDEAVHCRLPRTGEIGAHLSGGLDSSAIAVLAARQLREEGRTLHAYSFIDRQRNDITLEDETEFVKAVVEQEGDIDWTPIRPPAGLSVCGQPMDADNMTSARVDEPENAVCARAEDQGIGMVLSGWGGDEGATFNGRGTFAELFLRGRWRTLAREVLALKRERGWSVPRILNNEIISYLRPEGAIKFVRRISGRDADLANSGLPIVVQLRTPAPRCIASRGAQDGAERMREPLATDDQSAYRRTRRSLGADRCPPWSRLCVPATRPPRGRVCAFAAQRTVSARWLSPSSVSRCHDRCAAGTRPLATPEVSTISRLVLDVAEGANELLARIDDYAQNESVDRMVDLALLRRQVEAFPPPESLREKMLEGDNPAIGPAMSPPYPPSRQRNISRSTATKHRETKNSIRPRSHGRKKYDVDLSELLPGDPVPYLRGRADFGLRGVVRIVPRTFKVLVDDRAKLFC